MTKKWYLPEDVDVVFASESERRALVVDLLGEDFVERSEFSASMGKPLFATTHPRPWYWWFRSLFRGGLK